MKLCGKFLTNFTFLFSTSLRKCCSTAKTQQLQIPTTFLNNGHRIPVIGLGTWESLENDVKNAVTIAVRSGYRMIDTAFVYQNEKSIGEAIHQLIKDKVIERKDIFITSKLWNTYHQKDLVTEAVCLSLSNLRLSYLDLYLIHWPTAYLEGDELLPRDAKGRTKFSDEDYVETWKAMEKLQDLGLTKSIGLSNFNRSQIERVLKVARIKPAILQCECHPYLNQKKLMDFCRQEDIIFTAYSALGASPDRPYAVKGEDRLMELKPITDMAKRCQKTPAQILIRYQIQRGNIVIPKAASKSHIENNLQVFDWSLCAADMAILDDMNRNHRFVDKCRECSHHKYYPFWDEY